MSARYMHLSIISQTLPLTESPNSIDAETERQEHLRLPDTVTDTQIQNSMGPPPRTKYPLCVIVRSLEEESQLDSQPQIVSILNIILTVIVL